MKKLITVAACIVALVSATAAQAGSWIPGTPIMVEELDASDLLERSNDSAYCDGVARFGHVGEWPYDKYRVFDCSVSNRGAAYCDNRYKSVKGSRRGTFRLVLISRDCF
jgi:hypothetical protein